MTGQRPYDAKLHKWLHRISSPTLILWGEADRLIPVGQAAVWAGLIRGSEARTFAGAPHLLFNDSPDAVMVTGAFMAVEAYAAPSRYARYGWDRCLSTGLVRGCNRRT